MLNGTPRDRLAGERVLLAQPVGGGEGHLRGDFGAQAVAVVDGGRQHRARPVLDGPPAFVGICSNTHPRIAFRGGIGCDVAKRRRWMPREDSNLN